MPRIRGSRGDTTESFECEDQERIWVSTTTTTTTATTTTTTTTQEAYQPLKRASGSCVLEHVRKFWTREGFECVRPIGSAMHQLLPQSFYLELPMLSLKVTVVIDWVSCLLFK